MRDRAWRRYMEEKIVIRRLSLRVAASKRWYFHNLNGQKVENPMLKDYINTQLCNMFKTYKTDKYDSNYKIKYSPNKTKGYHRDRNKKSTREVEKIVFLNYLKENGIK
jgi:hypothetical protein